MKVSVIKTYKPNTYTVLLVQDVQSFRLDYQGTKEDANWYARMFRIALRKHVKQSVERG